MASASNPSTGGPSETSTQPTSASTVATSAPSNPGMFRQPSTFTSSHAPMPLQPHREEQYRNKPPNNIVYPPNAVQNLADNRDRIIPRIWFPRRLREMGYGGYDGRYEEGQPRKVYRPDKLPGDWGAGTYGQGYIRKESIWMVTDVDNRTPIYIIPPVCRQCPPPPPPNIAFAMQNSPDDYCDRGLSVCSPCIRKRMRAQLPGLDFSDTASQCGDPVGKEWEELEYSGKGSIPAGSAQIGSSSGASVPLPGGMSTSGSLSGLNGWAGEPPLGPPSARSTPHTNGLPLQAGTVSSGAAAATVGSRRKSSNIPGAIDVDGDPSANGIVGPPETGSKRKRKAKDDGMPSAERSGSSVPANNGATVATSRSGRSVLRPADDQGYQQRIRANQERTPLSEPIRPPVWAKKRRALSTGLEYFSNPISTFGGTVDVGTGGLTGIARMVLLEGDTGEDYVFWGSKKSLGTVVVPLGRPRPMRGCGVDPFDVSVPAPLPNDPTYPNTLETDERTQQKYNQFIPDLDPEARKAAQAPYTARLHVPGQHEEPAIAALLFAHRARTPIAVAVAEDYAVVPWQVPRPFTVLGWFWVTDAWPEPQRQELVVKSGLSRGKTVRTVRWRFRFDWCNKGQESHPWWEKPDPDVRCLFEPVKNQKSDPYDDIEDNNGYRPVLQPGLSPTETVRFPKREYRTGMVHRAEPRKSSCFKFCHTCMSASLEVYAGLDLCLNEECRDYWKEAPAPPGAIIPRKIILRIPRKLARLSPDDLGLRMRPRPADGKFITETEPSQAGKDFWKGWCCEKCGMVNERWESTYWSCENCQNRFSPRRRIWKAQELWPPMRPIPTGPRLEEGFPEFPPNQTSRSAQIWHDGLKIVLHGLPNQTEIYHALPHRNHEFSKDADTAFAQLQSQGQREIYLTRVKDAPPNARESDHTYHPAMTYVVGPPETPPVPALPYDRLPVPWSAGAPMALRTVTLINKLACRIIDGEKEFNTVLIALLPPNTPAVQIPWVQVPPNSSYAFLCLGADATISFRSGPTTRKKERASVKSWHGDLVLVRTYDQPLEVGLRAEGLTYFCLGRHVYPPQDMRPPTVAQSVGLPLVREEEVAYIDPELDDGIEPTKKQEARMPIEEQGWMIGHLPVFERPIAKQDELAAEEQQPAEQTQLEVQTAGETAVVA